jgi:hypothetical protein
VAERKASKFLLYSVREIYNHGGREDGVFITNVRDQKCIQNFGKQETLRELEHTGVDRILKHNR